jgi:glucose-6-phosphate isomerase
MESNGKYVTKDGQEITNYSTGPIIIWYLPVLCPRARQSNGQHAFTTLSTKARKIVLADCSPPNRKYTSPLISNPLGRHSRYPSPTFFAQTVFLMTGKLHQVLR